MIAQLIDFHKPLLEHESLSNISGKLIQGRYFCATDNRNHQVLIDAATVVGYCHYKRHPGLIVEEDFEKHRCLKKGCYYFQPYIHYPYLESHPEILTLIIPDDELVREKARRKKENEDYLIKCEIKKKEQAKAKKAKAQALSVSIKNYTELLIGDTSSLFMYVVKVEIIEDNRYKIFLVSDEDLEYNMSFLEYVKENAAKAYPGEYIFQRVHSPYGKYATKYEWDHRKKWK